MVDVVAKLVDRCFRALLPALFSSRHEDQEDASHPLVLCSSGFVLALVPFRRNLLLNDSSRGSKGSSHSKWRKFS